MKQNDLYFKPISKITSKEEARQIAIQWQSIFSSGESKSYRDLIISSNYFEKLGKKFSLLEEFKENGIV
jgi:hypothetical protein